MIEKYEVSKIIFKPNQFNVFKSNYKKNIIINLSLKIIFLSFKNILKSLSNIILLSLILR